MTTEREMNKDELLAAIAALQGERDAALADLKALQEAQVVPDPYIAELQGERDAALADLKALQEAPVVPDPYIAELKQENAELKKKLEANSSAAKVSRGAKPAKARKIGEVDDQPNAENLLELIAAADTIEIAFADGKRELADIAPVVVSGDIWTVSLDRLKLNLPELIVHGPAFGKPAYALAGYGLVLDGELVAYSKRPDTLMIGANSQMNLKDDIIF
jgi:hypothetical protein